MPTDCFLFIIKLSDAGRASAAGCVAARDYFPGIAETHAHGCAGGGIAAGGDERIERRFVTGRRRMPMSQDQVIESSIDALYLAVTNEEHWPEALAGVARAFDSPRIGVLRMPPALDGLYEMRALNHDPKAQRLYNEYYWALDPTHRLTRDAPVGEWLDGQPLFDPRTTRDREYVIDFAIPHGIRWVAGGKVHADQDSCTLLGLQRPADHRPFGDEARPVFGRLAKHIGRASCLSAELRQAQLAKGLSLAALDGIDWPVFAVSSKGRLLLANRSAERQLARAVPFSIRFGRLHCDSPEAATALQEALHQAARHRGSAFRVVAGRERWLVRTLPIAGYAGTALIYATAADPATIPAEILRQLLHLSQAEAEVAFLLAEGSSTKEIAFARGVSINTVRAQVRQIFEKAGVRRQSDLARLLFGIPQLRPPGE